MRLPETRIVYRPLDGIGLWDGLLIGLRANGRGDIEVAGLRLSNLVCGPLGGLQPGQWAAVPDAPAG